MVDGLEREATPAGYDDEFMAGRDESLAQSESLDKDPLLLELDTRVLLPELVKRMRTLERKQGVALTSAEEDELADIYAQVQTIKDTKKELEAKFSRQ
ncbi:MAG TPA: hypothetical protein PK263_00655 [bacterium]|nr:hypothetical protein [bacterium]